MGSFDITLQVEDSINCDEADMMDILQQNEEVYCGIDSLAQYGETVGFNSIEFSAACEEAFVNASHDVIAALASKNIYETDDFISFVVGFAYAKRYFKMF